MKIARWISRNSRLILIAALVLAVPAVVGFFKTGINYDILSYLPQHLDSMVKTATEAGDQIKKIVPDIQKTAELVDEIAAASEEQSSGVDQIAKAMMQLDSVVQANASSSEEMASMAEEFTGQAGQLAELVAFFKLRSDAEEAAAKKAQKAVGSETQRLAAARLQAAQPKRLAVRAGEAPVSHPAKSEQTESQAKRQTAIVPKKSSDEDFEEF